MLGQAGVDIIIIQKILGHTKIQTTTIYRETDRMSILAGIQKPMPFSAMQKQMPEKIY